MPRPIVMVQPAAMGKPKATPTTTGIGTKSQPRRISFIRQVSRAATMPFKSFGSSLTAGAPQCVACAPERAPATAPTPSSSTPAALESTDVVAAIASQISHKPTLAALSQADKTAHDATAPTLAASRAQHLQGQAALSNSRFSAHYYPRTAFLNLSGEKLTREDVNELVELIKHNTVLTRLSLRECDLDAEGGMAIAEALKGNTSLTSLDVRENNLNVGGAKAFGAALEVNRTLIDLNLAANNLCGKEKWMVYSPVAYPKDMSGVEALTNAAKKASWPDGALRSLNLDDNFLGSLPEFLLRQAMNKPAVVAERRAREREREENLAAQRRDCAEGRCDSSCIWCDRNCHGG